MTRNNTPWEEDSIKVNDADGNLAFEVIDLVKPDKLVPTFVKGAEYSDWRKELEESWSNVTTGNKVGQTFLHVPSGTTVSTGGAIGGVESIQSTINIAGEAVPAPDITSYTIQGYAVPFPGLIRKTKKEPVNTRLDASEKVAKKAKADVSMKARVDEKDPEDPIVRLNEWRKEVEKVGEYNDKIREANRAKASAYVSSKGFSWNKLEKEGALVDDKGYGIMITNGTPGGKIMTGKIKIGYGRPYTRKDTTQDGEFLGRKNSKGEWYYPNIPEMEARDGQLYKGMPVGKPVEIDLEVGIKESPPLPKDLEQLHQSQEMVKAALADLPMARNVLGRIGLTFDEIVNNVLKGSLRSYYGNILGGGIPLPAELTLRYAMGNTRPLTTSPGILYDKLSLVAIMNAFKSSSFRNGRYWVEPRHYDSLPTRVVQAAFNNFNFTITPDGIRVRDTFNFEDPNLKGNVNIGAFGAIPGAQWIATNLVKVGDMVARMKGFDPRNPDYGIKVDYIIPFSRLTSQQKALLTGSSSQPETKTKRQSLSLDKPIVRGKSKTKKSNWRSELNVN